MELFDLKEILKFLFLKIHVRLRFLSQIRKFDHYFHFSSTLSFPISSSFVFATQYTDVIMAIITSRVIYFTFPVV